MTHVPTDHEVETFSGRFVDTHSPKPSTIDLNDIGHALASICRYGGHCQRFYSVAEHAVFCSIRLERQGASKRDQLAALHHDDAEAYLGDIPRPLKPLLGQAYSDLSDRMDAAIVDGLLLPKYGVGVSDFHAQNIKEADNWALFVEARHLLPSQGKTWFGAPGMDAPKWMVGNQPSRIVTPDYWLGGITPKKATKLYLDRHHHLTK